MNRRLKNLIKRGIIIQKNAPAKCSMCGVISKEVELKIDPYTLELYDVIDVDYFCHDCYNERGWEV